MGMFKNTLLLAQQGNEKAMEKLLNRYDPLLKKCSIIQGHFDEDLYQSLILEFVRAVYKEWWYTKKRLMGASWQRDMVKNKESKRESLMRLAGEEFVIIDDFGWPRNPDGYNALVKRVAKKAGLKDIHPHMFRHTFVSLLMSNPDIGVATVAAEAGHAQPSTTLMIYTQQYKKRRESIRNQLSRELYEK